MIFIKSGELKPVCVAQAKNEKENRLLKKRDFAKFIKLLGEMNGDNIWGIFATRTKFGTN
ncbi:MAG: hypothetical protein LBS26_01140 [Campylobacteraceae bacterium]|nr:hypothetical protein [Campylobacteraceae bacterium]